MLGTAIVSPLFDNFSDPVLVKNICDMVFIASILAIIPLLGTNTSARQTAIDNYNLTIRGVPIR